VEPYRERIEDFIRRWRSRYEGNRVFRVLAAPLLIGAILVAGWLLVGSLKTSVLIPPVPRLSPDGPVVRNGVAVVVACGKKREFGAVESAPEPRTGTWGVERRGECSVYYHHPPGWEQRHARHERAH
jgi:hypothetical protein